MPIQTTLGIRLNRADVTSLRAAAGRAGLPLAEWCRLQLCRAAGLPDPPRPKPGWPLGKPRKSRATQSQNLTAAASMGPDGRTDGPDRPDAA